MAMTLYPPYIDGKIPTQVGDELIIPYEHNRVTSNYTGFKLLLKTVATNRQITVLSDEGEDAKFTLASGVLTNGQYYKAQLAYYKDNEGITTIGPYSTVGVFKYLSTKPTVIIEGLQQSSEGINNIQQEYKGTYTCAVDPTEKVYEYKFDLYELGSDEIIDTTGWQLHSYEDDPSTTSDTSSDFYSCAIELSANKFYKIQYSIKTINNLSLSSPFYLLSNNASYLPFQWILELKAYTDIDNACNKLILQFKDSQKRKIQGQFKIFRSSSKDNYLTFLELGDLYINEVIKSDQTYDLFEDFLIEHGFKYRYYIQQYYDTEIDNENKRLMTEKIPSNEVYSEFEDMFLCEYDKENQKVIQLKIKFNPKVSSFKTTTLESKTDTIGGKYPFFFRNGRTAYKDFPISGLISYFMDENGKFDNSTTYVNSINLSSTNITQEREFRNKVVNWLNNGHTKIFKSSTEGLFLVRLMNISLSPNDTVGRMLYSFNCNAYEIDTITQKSLKDLGYIGFVVKRVEEYLIKTKDLTNMEEITLDGNANMARIENAQFGERFKLTFKDNSTVSVTVGYTGVYEVNITPTNLLTKIKKESEEISEAQIRYGYNNDSENFALLNGDNKRIINYTTHQHFSQYYGNEKNNIEERTEIIKQIQSKFIADTEVNSKELLLNKIMYLRFQTKDIERIYKNKENNNYYKDQALTVQFIPNNSTVIYHVLNDDKYYVYIDELKEIEDFNNNSIYDIVIINDDKTIISLDSQKRIIYTINDTDKKFFNPQKIILGAGIYADISCLVTEQTLGDEELDA